MVFGLPPKPQPERFDKAKLNLESTGFVRTAIPIELGIAGPTARREPGAIAVGDHLLVMFQDDELTDESLEVWLTIENRTSEYKRWFGCSVLAWDHSEEDHYSELEPEPLDSGGHALIDIYPGEQYTVYYRFKLIPRVTYPKHLNCHSWDKQMTFVYAHGA